MDYYEDVYHFDYGDAINITHQVVAEKTSLDWLTYWSWISYFVFYLSNIGTLLYCLFDIRRNKGFKPGFFRELFVFFSVELLHRGIAMITELGANGLLSHHHFTIWWQLEVLLQNVMCWSTVAMGLCDLYRMKEACQNVPPSPVKSWIAFFGLSLLGPFTLLIIEWSGLDMWHIHQILFRLILPLLIGLFLMIKNYHLASQMRHHLQQEDVTGTKMIIGLWSLFQLLHVVMLLMTIPGWIYVVQELAFRVIYLLMPVLYLVLFKTSKASLHLLPCLNNVAMLERMSSTHSGRTAIIDMEFNL